MNNNSTEQPMPSTSQARNILSSMALNGSHDMAEPDYDKYEFKVCDVPYIAMGSHHTYATRGLLIVKGPELYGPCLYITDERKVELDPNYYSDSRPNLNKVGYLLNDKKKEFFMQIAREEERTTKRFLDEVQVFNMWKKNVLKTAQKEEVMVVLDKEDKSQKAAIESSELAHQESDT